MMKSEQPGIRLIQITCQKVRLELFSIKVIIMIIMVVAMVYTVDDVYPVYPRGTNQTMEEDVKCLEEGVAIV